MGRKGKRGETRGLDILSINILYPQHPFVSESNKSQGHVSKTEGDGGLGVTYACMPSMAPLFLHLGGKKDAL